MTDGKTSLRQLKYLWEFDQNLRRRRWQHMNDLGLIRAWLDYAGKASLEQVLFIARNFNFNVLDGNIREETVRPYDTDFWGGYDEPTPGQPREWGDWANGVDSHNKMRLVLDENGVFMNKRRMMKEDWLEGPCLDDCFPAVCERRMMGRNEQMA